MNTTEKLADFVVKTRYEDIPKAVIERTKELLLDIIGAAVAGSAMPINKILREYCKQKRSVNGEATVVGCGYLTSAEDAALINGTFLHSTELESVPMKGTQLTAIPAFAAFAIGEKFGLSGKDVLEGFILGFELYGRVSFNTQGISARGGWGCITGNLGAAATAGKMLRLNTDQMRMAIGLAASQASGLIEQIGTMTHFIELGIATANGTRAALWAKEGMTSILDVLENPKGFCQFHAGKGGYNLEEMTRDLGKYYFVTEPGVSIKKYPCCYRTHRALDATFELIKENNINYEDVDEVRVDENLYDRELLKYSEPVVGNDGRFSMEHCLAAALVDRRVDEETFSDHKIRALKEARKKIKVIVHEEWPPERSSSRTPVMIRLNNGKEYFKELDKPKDPTREQIIERYKAGAKSILSEKEIEESAEKIWELEKVKKISELMDLVRGRG